MKTAWTANAAQTSLENFKQVLQRAEATNNLEHGNVVALHSSYHNRFVRLMGNGSVDTYGGKKNAEDLPLSWNSERFLVIQCGDSRFAFYSICHQRYIMVGRGGGAVRAGTKKTLEDPIDDSEIFDIRKLPDTKTFSRDSSVALFSAATESFVSVRPNGTVDTRATKIKSFEHLQIILIMKNHDVGVFDDSSTLVTEACT